MKICVKKAWPSILAVALVLAACANPLLLEINRGSPDGVQRLLEKGENPNAPFGSTGRSPVSEAVRKNKLDSLEILLKYGGDPNTVADGVPVLVEAVALGQLEIAKMLMEYGADPALTNLSGSNAIHWAAGKSAVSVIRSIPEKHKALFGRELPYKHTPLHVAALSGNPEIVEALIDRGAEIDPRDANDMTPLLLAITTNRPDVAEMLLRRGANPMIVAPNGVFPLTEAAARGQSSVISKILELGVDVNARSPTGKTPLAFAVENGHFEATRVLLQAGADPTIIVAPGRDVYSLVTPNQDIEALLKSHGERRSQSASQDLPGSEEPSASSGPSGLDTVPSVPPKSATDTSIATPIGIGTAWRAADGIYLTNAHVVVGAKAVTLRNPRTKVEYPVVVLLVDELNDMAVLSAKPDFAARGQLSLRMKPVRAGEQVYVLGYPLGDELGLGLKITSGIVSSTSGLGDLSSMFQLSAPINPGNSGGPVLDRSGNVIGMVVAKIKSSLADNVGLAIKTLSVLAALQTAEIDVQSSPESQLRDPTEIYEIARTQIFQVVAY